MLSFKTIFQALLGFHVVFSLIAFTVFTKFRSKFGYPRSFLFYGLYRYVAPSNRELKEMMQIANNGKIRKKKLDRDLETNGFLVPKGASIALTAVPVTDSDVSRLPFYSLLCWITDYSHFAILMYCCSEVYLYLFPHSQAVNVSVVWILLLIAFLMQGLAELTGSLFFGSSVEGERNVIVSFAALFFFFSMLFLMFAENYFDIGFKEAYDSFTNTTAKLFAASGLPEMSLDRSPLLLFVTLSLLIAFLGAMLVFPNLRYSRMYAGAVREATPIFKLTAAQLNCLRIWSVILTVFVRLLVKQPHLQSHLNLSVDALRNIKSHSGNINSLDLQKMVFRYFSYLNVATLQYLLPTLLPLSFVFLLKTLGFALSFLGDYSWVGKDAEFVLSEVRNDTMASLSVLLGPKVQRGIWTLFLIATMLLNSLISLIGFFYNRYILNV
uniref:Transmembrane protein 161B n=1 Tax=Syphacia muris TaxID=451379 RepID=A0A0N5AUL0_9BILA